MKKCAIESMNRTIQKWILKLKSWISIRMLFSAIIISKVWNNGQLRGWTWIRLIFTTIILSKNENNEELRRGIMIQNELWNENHKYKQEWYSPRLFFQKVKIKEHWEYELKEEWYSQRLFFGKVKTWLIEGKNIILKNELRN
jgi:hypothetical protein